jgi:hypothetical protein
VEKKIVRENFLKKGKYGREIAGKNFGKKKVRNNKKKKMK